MLWKQIGWMKLEIKKNTDLSKKKLSESLVFSQHMKLTDSKLFKKSTKEKMRKICERILISYDSRRLKASRKIKKMRKLKFMIE